MSSDPVVASRQHARAAPPLPQQPEPSHAERVRTLLSQVTTGMLSTLSRKHSGFPFGSLMPFALDAEGRALFLISNMAMHTQNLKADAHASLFVAQAAEGGDPLGVARATVVGLASPVPEGDLALAPKRTLQRMQTANTGSISRISAFSGLSLSMFTTLEALA